jgi:hypothetical protein
VTHRDVVDPGPAMPSNHVVPAVELAVSFQLVSVLRLCHDRTNHILAQAAYLQMPENQKFHLASLLLSTPKNRGKPPTLSH